MDGLSSQWMYLMPRRSITQIAPSWTNCQSAGQECTPDVGAQETAHDGWRPSLGGLHELQLNSDEVGMSPEIAIRA